MNGVIRDSASLPESGLSLESVREVIEEIDDILGDEFQKVWDSHQRSVNSSTPTANAHRLAKVRFEAKSAVESRRPEDSTHYERVAELRAARNMLRKCQRWPQWESIRKAMTNPDS